MLELSEVKGIGPKTEMLLNKIGITNIDDLVTHYPFRYDVIKKTDISNLQDEDKVIIDGIIEIYFIDNLVSKKLGKTKGAIQMTKKEIRNILTQYGYVLEEHKGRFNLIDRRNCQFLTFGYTLTLVDVEAWIHDNIRLENLEMGR